jgi:hypothetical protein
MTNTDIHSCGYYCDRHACIKAQRDELREKMFSEQAVKTYEQEPQETIAKWIKANTEHRQWYICPKCSYQAPRFRDEWVGLTDEEARELCVANVPYVIDMVRALEAKLKERNGG